MSLFVLEEAMNRIYDVIQNGGTLREACLQANVSPAAHYHWLKSYAGYREGYDLAIQLRNRVLEDVLLSRAIDGQFETRVTFNVMPDGSKIPVEEIVTKRFDNALAIRLLAANEEKYNTKVKSENKSDANLIEILASARKRLEDSNGGASDA